MNRNNNYFIRTLSILKRNKKKVIIILFLLVFLMTASFLMPIISKKIIDNGFLQRDISVIISYSVFLFMLYLSVAMFSIIKEKERLIIFNDVQFVLRKWAFDKLLVIKMDYFQSNNEADIYQFLEEDINKLSGIVSEDAFSIITSIFMAIGGGTALFMIDWRLGIAVMCFIPVKYVITELIAIRNAKIIRKYNNDKRDYSGWFGESVKGIKEIRQYGLKKQKRQELVNRQKEILSTNLKHEIYKMLNEQAQDVLVQLLIAAIYIVSGFFLLKDGISVGSIIAFESYALVLTTPLSDIINLNYEIKEMTPSLERYYSFIDYEEEKGGSLAKAPTYDIEFRDCSFSYGDKTILNGASLFIPSGCKIVIMGDNGAGKTTVLNLLNRFINPINGAILLGDNSIEEYDIEYYRNSISFVRQEVFLFNDTLMKNICIANKLDISHLRELIRLIGLEETIKQKGEGYIVGDNGSKLSGGQRQKIALVRAFSSCRPIVILDEATSNLDEKTISNLGNIIEFVAKDATVICVTHSENILRFFDRVIRISDGKFVEIDKNQE